MIYYKKKSCIKKIFKNNYKNSAKTSFAAIFSIFKKTLYPLFFLVFLAYVSYLFLLPYFVNEENVETIINNYLSKNSKLVFDTDNLKIYPNYKFDINLKANSITVKYPSKQNFIVLEKPNIDINLLTLLFGYLDLDKIKIQKIAVNTNFTKNNRYSCFDYFDFDLFDLKSKNSKFELRNIKLSSDVFLLNLYDENLKKNFYIKTKGLKIASRDYSKPFEITTKGTMGSNAHKICDFNLALSYKLNSNSLNKFKEKLQNLNYNPLKDALRYKFYTIADIDLKASPQDKKANISGKINLKDYTFEINNIKLPKNNLLVLFKDDSISSECEFNFTKNQFIKIKTKAQLSKNKFIEAKLTSNEINLADTNEIINAFLDIFKINKNDIQLDGYLAADLYLKSNFKTINSSGKLLIKDAKLHHKKTNLSLSSINSDINFSNNKIDILNTGANIDKARFYLKGQIDDKTNLDLTINSEPLNIANFIALAKDLPLISSLLPALDDYTFNDGVLKINAQINGNLKKPLIKTNSNLSNLKVYIKSLGSTLNAKEILISAYPEAFNLKDIFITAADCAIKYDNYFLKLPKTKLNIKDNNIIISKSPFNCDEIKGTIEGNIKNYKDKQSELNLSILAEIAKNNKIIALKNKNAALRAVLSIKQDKMTISSFDISDANSKIASISGTINSLKSQNPILSNIKIIINQKTGVIVNAHQNLSFDIGGSLLINGKIKNPDISGRIDISDLVYKDLNLYTKDILLNIKNSIAYLSIEQGKIFDFDFNLNSKLKLRDNKSLIETVQFSSGYINLDSIEKYTKKSNLENIEIQNLKGNIALADAMGLSFKSVNFEGKLKDNILELSNLNADFCSGKINGRLLVNLKNYKTKAELIVKEINTRQLSRQFKELSIAASGKLSALINAQFQGFSFNDIIKTFDGYIKFNIDNGELAQFAKLERFLQAGNILSQSILKLTLNSTISAVTKQNTGDFKTIAGTLKVKNANADIQYIKTQGSNMSLYLTGNFNLLSRYTSVKILGRIPSSIVKVFGNAGKFSTEQLVDKMSDDARDIIKTITVSPVEKRLSTTIPKEETAKIPPLSYQNPDTITREFIVIIDGKADTTNSIKYFKWILKEI